MTKTQEKPKIVVVLGAGASKSLEPNNKSSIVGIFGVGEYR